MKATLTEEPAVYTIEVNGQKIKGMRAAGDLGPVRMLKNDKGEQVLVMRGGSDYARLIDDALMRSPSAEVTLIAASPSLLDAFNPPPAAAPAAGE